MERKKNDAFISYNREDITDVKSIVNQLKQRSPISIFMDIDLAPGENWLNIIGKEILRCEAFLFFIRNPPKYWQIEELQIAIQQQVKYGKPFIIPVLLPNIAKNAFLGNPNLTFISSNNAAQFSSSTVELDVIDSIIRSIVGNKNVYVSTNAIPRKDKLPSGFKVDLGKLTGLLIGEAVYQSKKICIRELIQNSRDACSRKRAFYQPEEKTPKIIVKIDKENRYFDVIDYGDGMTLETLNNSFSILGSSYNDNYHNNDVTKQSILNPITGKFGIGFISVFMISKRIVISTKSSQEKAYHFSINDVKSSFVYSEESKCGRNHDHTGTTIRVYLLPEFSNGISKINIYDEVILLCRHVPKLFLIKNNKRKKVKINWNLEKKSDLISIIKTDKYEARISWCSGKNATIKLSNGGFFVSNLDYGILGDFPRGLISGEINFSPSYVDLNISRDKIINNKKVIKIQKIIKKSLINLYDLSISYLEKIEDKESLSETSYQTLLKIRRASTIAHYLEKYNKIGNINIGDSIDFEYLYKESLLVYLSHKSSQYSNGIHSAYYVNCSIVNREINIVYGAPLNTKKNLFIDGRISFDYVSVDLKMHLVQINEDEETITEEGIISDCSYEYGFNIISQETALEKYYSYITFQGLIYRLFHSTPKPILKKYSRLPSLIFIYATIIIVLYLYFK